ncbi:hypothetical protein DERF_003259 [Dermatophagoides farinae]|uniref:Uncharacterized protein n=1 Tax=Dermatophagoides farinae TaxID=6954 RepID=A0A922IC92_DERFA|nr:hypothetical protein DERF_003259 [Dermatophagoides farinae]
MDLVANIDHHHHFSHIQHSTLNKTTIATTELPGIPRHHPHHQYNQHHHPFYQNNRPFYSTNNNTQSKICINHPLNDYIIKGHLFVEPSSSSSSSSFSFVSTSSSLSPLIFVDSR